jgi:hypothetical protein
MRNLKVLCVVGCTGLLVACGSNDATEPEAPKADIGKVVGVKSSFGPQFKVTDIPPTGIDPKLLSPQAMPPGMKFDPADCAKFAEGQLIPPGLKGNMAATSAEGDGNRFIALAVETSAPIPANDPAANCQKVGFANGAIRGMVEVVEAPKIDGVHTLGTHRVLQTVVQGKPRTGELYNYVANFGSNMVIVTANPLVIPGQPVAPVDTKRARDLLTAAVAAVKG